MHFNAAMLSSGLQPFTASVPCCRLRKGVGALSPCSVAQVFDTSFTKETGALQRLTLECALRAPSISRSASGFFALRNIMSTNKMTALANVETKDAVDLCPFSVE